MAAGTSNKDYYRLLCITRDATREDINGAFRKLSLRWHPEKNASNRAESAVMFADVCEAYEVLGDPKWRALYDLHGEDGIKNALGGGYKFSGDPQVVFQKFFGVDNPWAVRDELPHQFFSKEGQRDKSPPQCPSISVVLHCTLEELFFGTTKVLSYPVEHADANGAVVRNSTEELRVNIPYGSLCDSVIKFPNVGNSRDGWIRGDVHVSIIEWPHDRFTRHGNDLHRVERITLTQALTGFPVEVVTLDQRNVRLFINEVVHNHYTKRVAGFGFPKLGADREDINSFGDLVLSFDIVFPTYLDSDRQNKIKEALQDAY